MGPLRAAAGGEACGPKISGLTPHPSGTDLYTITISASGRETPYYIQLQSYCVRSTLDVLILNVLTLVLCEEFWAVTKGGMVEFCVHSFGGLVNWCYQNKIKIHFPGNIYRVQVMFAMLYNYSYNVGTQFSTKS